MTHDDEALEALTRPRHAKFWTVDRLIKLLVFACFLVVAGFVFLLRQQGVINGRISETAVEC